MSYPHKSNSRIFEAFYLWALKFATRQTGVYVTGGVGVKYQSLTPVDAQSTALDNDTGGVYMNHSGTIAAHTLTMPTAPEDGQEYAIAARSEVTSLTHNAGAGHTIRGALTTIAANGYAKYRFDGTGLYWARIG